MPDPFDSPAGQTHSAYTGLDHAGLIRLCEQQAGKIAELGEDRSNLIAMTALIQTKLQSAGSPPPGGIMVLAQWVVDTTVKRIARLETDLQSGGPCYICAGDKVLLDKTTPCICGNGTGIGEKEGLRNLNIELQERIARLEAATVELQRSLSETQQLCVKLEQERDQYQQAVAGYKSDAKLLRREHEQMRQERDQLKAKVEQMKSAITKAAEEGLGHA